MYEKYRSNLMVVSDSWKNQKFDQKVDRVLVKAMPGNADLVWLDIDGTAAANHCYPLEQGESLTLAVDNLNKLDFLFVNAADKVCFIWEVERYA